MKYLKYLFIFFLVLGCQKTNEKHIAIGTWNRCNKDGSYIEYKITDQYMLLLSTKSDEIFLCQNKVLNKNLILSELKDGTKLLTDNDTLITVKKSKNKVILKSTYTWDYTELNNAEFDFDPIDSTNLESWKNKAISEFKRRAELANCPDLRTEKEKIIPTLDDFEEEEIQIIETEK